MIQICSADVSAKVLLSPQIRAMRRAGYRVLTICSRGPFTRELRQGDLHLYPLPITRRVTPLTDLTSIWRLYRLFRRCRPTIVHTHTPKAALLGQIAATLARVPLRVNTVHGFLFCSGRGIRRAVMREAELLACRLSHHVFSQSVEDVEMLARGRMVSPAKVEWIGNGINLAQFEPSRWADHRAEVRRELALPQDAFIVGIVARMVREKGFAELFEAFARFRARAPNAYLMQVGMVDQERGDQASAALADRWGVRPWCRFVGHQEQVPRFLAAMDLFCLPSYREGYPRSVLEASAMGVPAVVTNIRGCREAVVEGVNGVLVPPRSVGPLADAMGRLYADPALRNQMSSAALRRAAQEFDERRVIRLVLRRYYRWAPPPTPTHVQNSTGERHHAAVHLSRSSSHPC